MCLIRHGAGIKMCYRVTRDRFSESRDDLSIVAQRCMMLTSCAIRKLYATYHLRAHINTFNLSKSSTVSFQSQLQHNPAQHHSSDKKGTLAANHHQTIRSVTMQRAV